MEADLAHHFAVACPELKIGEARTLVLNEVAITLLDKSRDQSGASRKAFDNELSRLQKERPGGVSGA